MCHGLTLALSKTDRFETAQRFSQSCHRQLARSRANREHRGTLAFQYRNKLWANLLQCLPVGVDFAGKARPSDASAILLELALDDKAGRAVGKRERGGLAMSNADVLLRQDDETVDVPQTSQYQDSRPVIRGHKSQENALARVRAERPALLVTLVGRNRRDSAHKHGKRGNHDREQPASKSAPRHRIAPLNSNHQHRRLLRPRAAAANP